jgi:hypothetical protein
MGMTSITQRIFWPAIAIGLLIAAASAQLAPPTCPSTEHLCVYANPVRAICIDNRIRSCMDIAPQCHANQHLCLNKDGGLKYCRDEKEGPCPRDGLPPIHDPTMENPNKFRF